MHVNDAVLLAGLLRHQFRLLILHADNRIVLSNGQQGIEQAHHQVLVFTEHQLKSQVSLRVQILAIRHRFSFRFLVTQ